MTKWWGRSLFGDALVNAALQPNTKPLSINGRRLWDSLMEMAKIGATAKGGVIIGICDELKVPVSWAGVGEKVADLRKFEPREFVEALFDV